MSHHGINVVLDHHDTFIPLAPDIHLAIIAAGRRVHVSTVDFTDPWANANQGWVEPCLSFGWVIASIAQLHVDLGPSGRHG